MGISTAPDEYQACMERILGDLDFVIVYLDDILIFSENPVEHLEHLRIVFDRLRQYDVTLNGKKCHILRDRVDYYTRSRRDSAADEEGGSDTADRRTSQQARAAQILGDDRILP
ncbi:unnamed protein product [Phytophthora fragariaefolia]|uniref:Unnamed protein product n=1 Tax=Phytophthora fragariaefolia TaxID=1490495 RepID=A0A9W7D543_9STRA|nr:unnamed protein product [Phytophthora fragariaefolia]